MTNDKFFAETASSKVKVSSRLAVIPMPGTAAGSGNDRDNFTPRRVKQ